MFISLLLSFKVSAQFNTYHPFPDSNANWNESNIIYAQFAQDDKEYYFNYFLGGDTLMNGHIYIKLYQGMKYTSSKYGYHWVDTIGFVSGIREDNNKHIYFNKGSGEQLLYDFNLKIGDTLTQLIGNGYVVTNIDSTLIGLTYRKQFILSGEIDSIIEGIGSVQGLFENVEPFNSQTNSGSLICFSQNGKKLYPDTGSICEIYTGISNLAVPISSFAVYPNPASKQVTIDITLSQGLNTGTLELYNSMGKLIRTTAINNAPVTLTENISTLANGVYYYKLITNNSVPLVKKLIVIQ